MGVVESKGWGIENNMGDVGRMGSQGRKEERKEERKEKEKEKKKKKKNKRKKKNEKSWAGLGLSPKI